MQMIGLDRKSRLANRLALLVSAAQEIHDRAKLENRDLTAAEQTDWDNFLAQLPQLST